MSAHGVMALKTLRAAQLAPLQQRVPAEPLVFQEVEVGLAEPP